MRIVPPGAATYLSTVDGKVIAETNGVWVNFSGGGGRAAAVRAFDVLNREPGWRPFPLDVSVVPHTGSTGAAEIGTVTVRVSVDDGRTWRAGAEFVSLTVKAADAAGNSMERTTIKACGVNRPLG